MASGALFYPSGLPLGAAWLPVGLRVALCAALFFHTEHIEVAGLCIVVVIAAAAASARVTGLCRL